MNSPARPIGSECRNVHDPRLLIDREGDLEVRYAPFDHVNPEARIVILGITPGAKQATAHAVGPHVGIAHHDGLIHSDPGGRVMRPVYLYDRG